MPSPTPTTVDAATRRRTVLGHLVAARDLDEHLGTFLTDPTRRTAATLIENARLVSVLDKRLKTMAVIKAVLVHDATWAEVAHRLGVEEATARKLYGEAVTRWAAGDPAPWAPTVCAPGTRAGRARLSGRGLLPIEIDDGNVDALEADMTAYIKQRRASLFQ